MACMRNSGGQESGLAERWMDSPRAHLRWLRQEFSNLFPWRCCNLSGWVLIVKNAEVSAGPQGTVSQPQVQLEILSKFMFGSPLFPYLHSGFRFRIKQLLWEAKKHVHTGASCKGNAPSTRWTRSRRMIVCSFHRVEGFSTEILDLPPQFWKSTAAGYQVAARYLCLPSVVDDIYILLNLYRRVFPLPQPLQWTEPVLKNTVDDETRSSKNQLWWHCSTSGHSSTLRSITKDVHGWYVHRELQR